MNALVGLGTRTRLPALPHPLVRRERLLDQLDHARQITLIVAPAGSGKSTLMADWVSHVCPVPAVWLTIAAGDDVPGGLARNLVAAFGRAGRCRPGPADAHEAALVDWLWDEIEPAGEVVLVLDDVHELGATDAWRLLRHVLATAPPNVRVVLAARDDPPAGFARLAVLGRLTRLEFAELAFTVGEAAELFAAQGLRLTPAAVSAVHQCTEGWAAALALTALSLTATGVEQPFDPVATAAAVVVDYVGQEILDRLDRSDYRVLLRTAVADEVNADLAVALTGEVGAPARLERLSRSGCFVHLASDGWFRRHRLVTDVLRHRFQLEDAEEARALTVRAAEWFAERGDVERAEYHARRSGDWELTGRLYCRRWTATVLAGDGDVMDSLAAAPAGPVATPEWHVLGAARAIRAGDAVTATLHRDRAGDLVGSSEGAASPDLALAIDLVDALHARAFGPDDRFPRALDHLEHPDPMLDVDDVRSVLAVASLLRGEHELDRGDVHAARLALERAEAIASVIGRVGVAAEAAAALAVLDAACGHPERVAPAGPDLPPLAAEARRVAVAVCLHMQGAALTAAEEMASVDLEPLRVSRPLLAAATAARYGITVATRRGRGDAPSLLRHPLANLVLVALGVLEVPEPSGRPRSVGGHHEHDVARARRAVAAGATGEVTALLTPWCGHERDRVHPRCRVEAATLLALAEDRDGRHAAAAGWAGVAIDLAARTGITAPLHSAPPALHELVRRCAHELIVANPGASMLIDVLTTGSRDGVVEPLTARERAVLACLPTMMSNEEIAGEMLVSVNTVKTHLKALYRKLGVERRRDAVVRARQLELM